MSLKSLKMFLAAVMCAGLGVGLGACATTSAGEDAMAGESGYADPFELSLIHI